MGDLPVSEIVVVGIGLTVCDDLPVSETVVVGVGPTVSDAGVIAGIACAVASTIAFDTTSASGVGATT